MGRGSIPSLIDSSDGKDDDVMMGDSFCILNFGGNLLFTGFVECTTVILLGILTK